MTDTPPPDAPQPMRAPWPETPEIHNRGMGPEVRGTRIVMTDIYQMLDGWTHEQIAEMFRLTLPQVRAAVAYIDAHRDRVEADMAAIRARAARGNSPEVREKLKGSHERLLAFRKRLEDERRATGEVLDARASG